MTDWTKVLQDMAAAAEKIAQKEWPKLKGEAEAQFQTLTEVAARVEARKARNDISETNARFLMYQYKMAAQNVMFSIEGLANLLVEQALNAALAVLNNAIKAATGGWMLL